jgi:exopolyphosphatase/guanosine-5'-triphosphate,3'-diphosphate pyrophosphatase
MATPASLEKRVGLGYWMNEVLLQCEKVADGFASDPVHDLRTALRRCRSMADGIMVFDPAPAWKKMKKSGRQLFRSLGALRDTHVLQEWIEKLTPENAAAAKTFAEFLRVREQQDKQSAALALEQFNRKQWSVWAGELPGRAARIPLDSPVFAHLALERWHEAHALHGRALRNRTNVAFHDLRIGIKRFRYTVENFLPSLHEAWGLDLKELQDALGDVHDLDVLWHTAASLRVFPDPAARAQWRDRIEQEREEHLQEYRRRMVGSGSLWPVWRAALPKAEDVRSVGFQRLGIWASFLDPNVRHSKHVANLAVQLFDGLPIDGMHEAKRESSRYVLRAAALMHDVGYSRVNQGHHKESARLIRKLTPPLGWTADEIRTVSLIARYHRGALPRETQKTFAVLPKSKQWLVQFLGGILRLACAFDRQHDNQIRRLQVESSNPVLTVRAEGYTETMALAEHVAAARHLLETACHQPILVQPLEARARAA